MADRSTPGTAADGAYFGVSADRDGDGVRLVAHGELDAASAQELSVALRRESRPGQRLSLDLAGVTFIDSSGLRVIAAESRRYQESDTTFTIEAVSEPVRRILEMTGLTGLIDLQS